MSRERRRRARTHRESNGVNTFARTVGGAVGSQFATAVLATMTVPGATVPPVAGHSTSFLIAAVAALLGAATMPLLRPRPTAPIPTTTG
ncbi:hypothetical protein ABZ260_02005 [Streptosporangium sp. NPDC006013]|uniref:hypothetical protein n=1 Tax=Streptosporangium sp. NPDC006013 TaxID=3155596 RepID=UPI0033A39166